MKNMVQDRNVKKLLRSRSLAPKKRLGQNFLVNPGDAERIVDLAGIRADDIVIEVGVGLGALTRPLAARAARVIGVEIDSGIIRYHQEEKQLPDNVTLIHQDILKSDFQHLADQGGGRLKLIANLPYSISNPLLFKLFENQERMSWAVLMLQKEVGQRLTAPVGCKAYGVLSVLIGGCAGVTSLMTLGPGHFHPRPKVDSVVVRIDFASPPPHVLALPPHDRGFLRQVVNGAFQQRRKTLRNALSSGASIGLSREEVEQSLNRAGIAPETRAERLSTAEFVRLTNCLALIRADRSSEL